MSDTVDNMEEPSKSWSVIFYDFTQSTTFHGIRYVWDKTSKSNLRRFLWMVLFLVATGFFLNQVIERVIYFMGAPVTVKVEVNFNKTLRFPAVILCNQNSFRITVANEKNYKPMLDEFYELEEGDPERLKIIKKYGYDDLRMDKLMIDTSHRKEDMVVKCSWKGDPCGVDNFTQIMTDHGVCFAFNANPNDSPLLLSESGTESALNLVLNIEQYENMIGPHFAAGLKILLYDENDVPVFLGHGQGLAAGSHTFAGTSVVVMRRLPEPFGNCSLNLKLDYYPKYTERACHVECFTKYFTSQAGCRLPYMRGGAPVCTLYQYAEKMRTIQIEFDQAQESLCQCSPPCESVVYEPSFSYLKASDFDVDKLLDEDTRKKLSKKLRAAHDTLRWTEADLKLKDDKLLNQFITGTRRLKILLYVILPDLLSRQVEFTHFVQAGIKNVYKSIISIYEFQLFVVRKNFYRFVEYSDEMYFSEVSTGYLDFLTKYIERLERMTWLLNQPHADIRREVILDSIETTLNAKHKVIDYGHDAFQKCIESYKTGTVKVSPPYVYKNKDSLAHELIIPKHRLRHVVQYGVSGLQLGKRNKVLEGLKSFYLNLKSIAQDSFRTGRVNMSAVIENRETYNRLITEYNTKRSTMLNDIFIAPVKQVEKFVHDLDDIFVKVRDAFAKINQHLATLDSHWNKTMTKHWPVVSNVLNAALHYMHGNDSVGGKMALAEYLIRPSVKDTIQTLYDFLNEVLSVVDDVNSLWSWIYQQFRFKFLEEKVMEDSDMIPYLKQYMPGLANKQNFENTTTYKMIAQVLTSHSIWSNFEQTVLDVHAPFYDAYHDVLMDMQAYIKSNEVGTKFYKDNFLSLVIYFQEMNYELIQQQAAYTIFALLSDIGGSMGLFVGGSVISIFEIIDVFLYNQISRKMEENKLKKKKMKAKNDTTANNGEPVEPVEPVEDQTAV